MSKKRKPKPNKRDQHAEKKKVAMPTVKQLVAHFGRTVVQSCLNDIKERDKSAERLADLKRQTAELENKLK